MQYVDCKLLLNSDRNFEIHKTRISVAEVVLLRLIHGPESVQDIRDAGKDTASLPKIRTDLIERYGGDSAEGVKRIDAMFANIHMQGLTKLSDIVSDEASREPKGVKSAAKSVGATELQPEDG